MQVGSVNKPLTCFRKVNYRLKQLFAIGLIIITMSHGKLPAIWVIPNMFSALPSA